MTTSNIVRLKQAERQATLGAEMAEDFNDRFRDRDDSVRTIAAAFFLSNAVLSPLTERAFLVNTGMQYKTDGFGNKQLTYNPPLEQEGGQ